MRTRKPQAGRVILRGTVVAPFGPPSGGAPTPEFSNDLAAFFRQKVLGSLGIFA
jgi:hypothetical protein